MHGNALSIDAEGRYLIGGDVRNYFCDDPERCAELFLTSAMIPNASTAMYRREALLALGGWDERLSLLRGLRSLAALAARLRSARVCERDRGALPAQGERSRHRQRALRRPRAQSGDGAATVSRGAGARGGGSERVNDERRLSTVDAGAPGTPISRSWELAVGSGDAWSLLRADLQAQLRRAVRSAASATCAATACSVTSCRRSFATGRGRSSPTGGWWMRPTTRCSTRGCGRSWSLALCPRRWPAARRASSTTAPTSHRRPTTMPGGSSSPR